jgi:hypothetical protein
MTAYNPGVLQIIPRPVDGAAKVADCSAVEDNIAIPTHLGAAGFGDQYGYNPCGGDPVVTTTWSGVKSLYGH